MNSPSTSDILEGLAERLEKASGPDVETAFVDRDIYRIVSNTPDADLLDAPNYSGSLDAAMTLVPEGRAFVVEYQPRPTLALSHARVHDSDRLQSNYRDGEAVIPASALAAAALRARAGI